MQTLNLDWLARQITSFKANQNCSLKIPTLTPKFRLVQNSIPSVLKYATRRFEELAMLQKKTKKLI